MYAIGPAVWITRLYLSLPCFTPIELVGTLPATASV